MAVNNADGMAFGGAIICPILAMLSVRGDAGWLTVPSVVAALPVCLAVLYVGRRLTYLVVGFGLRLSQPMKPWIQDIFGVPFYLAYFILPVVGLVAAVSATSYTAMQFVELAGHVGGWIGLLTVSLAAVISAVATVAFWKWYFWLPPWTGVSA